MEQVLSNTASAVGNYNSIPTSITSKASVVTMIDGLSITKSADKTIWADENLTYTIVIQNDSEKTYSSPKITDVLDTSLVTFVEGSVVISGNIASSSEYSFDTSTNTLTITLQDIAPNNSTTVKFQVAKADNPT